MINSVEYHRKRAALFFQRAHEYEQKAQIARSDEMRRSWIILARDWRKMAEHEELKRYDAEARELSEKQLIG
jgi:hypothetical protein